MPVYRAAGGALEALERAAPRSPTRAVGRRPRLASRSSVAGALRRRDEPREALSLARARRLAARRRSADELAARCGSATSPIVGARRIGPRSISTCARSLPKRTRVVGGARARSTRGLARSVTKIVRACRRRRIPATRSRSLVSRRRRDADARGRAAARTNPDRRRDPPRRRRTVPSVCSTRRDAQSADPTNAPARPLPTPAEALRLPGVSGSRRSSPGRARARAASLRSVARSDRAPRRPRSGRPSRARARGRARRARPSARRAPAPPRASRPGRRAGGGRAASGDRRRCRSTMIAVLREDDRALETVAQLADVARPVVGAQPLARRGVELERLLLELSRKRGEKPVDERIDVLAPLAQRRDADREDAHAVEEVLAEEALGDEPVEGPVRGGDDPHVDLDRRRPADAVEGALLQHAQELGLRRRRELADLVQEDRAAVGELELPEPARRGAREGALLVAEELALEQRVRNRRAVDRDERPRRAATRARGSRGRRAPCRCRSPLREAPSRRSPRRARSPPARPAARRTRR